MGATRLQAGGNYSYRDLNKNGRLDPYEDSRLPLEERVEDLLSQMTLEEKAGLMFQPGALLTRDGNMTETSSLPGRPSTAQLITSKHLNHFNIWEAPAPRQLAEWQNRVQEIAEYTRLGIPVTISSDPRHGFIGNMATSAAAMDFSQWPEPIGLAATGDPELVEQFADIARREYIAVGIRTALHPMADLATEPRWARISGTFGEDAELASKMVGAYIRGFQGRSLGVNSVACMTKHFPGGGPQKDGEDPHFPYGREQVYPGDNFNYHLKPFEAAFAAGTAMIMPYYGMPVGLPIEEVGFGFNRDVITGLLREKYRFDGVVCTDWGLLTDLVLPDETMLARAWGVEGLSLEERTKKVLDAGADQFGGESCPEVIVELVRSGKVPEERIDQSVRRLLRDKFRLGLFDDPYVDAVAAQTIVGSREFRAAGADAQRKAIVLLKNVEKQHGGSVLPLSGRPKLFLKNVSADVAAQYGDVVGRPEDADIAIVREGAPFEPRPGFLERIFHAGDLSFQPAQKAALLTIMATVPTIFCITLDRPAVIPEMAEHCAGLVADFGAGDDAVLDVVFGHFTPSGRLPFELPASMQAVREQKPDVPCDSKQPLFAYGCGLTY
jgi:beta-glucosidase